MATQNVKVNEIATSSGANLNNNQICNETSANATTGFKMWAGKDNSGTVTRWLALDQNAQVADLTVTGDVAISSGSITVDALSLSTAQANRVLYGDFQQDGSFKYENSLLGVGGTKTPTHVIDITQSAALGLRIEDTASDSTPPTQVFEKDSASPADNDGIGKIIYRGKDGNQSAPAERDFVTIEAKSKDVSGVTGEYKITVLREAVSETFLMDENGFEISRGIMTLKETTTPTAKQHHGKIYTKADNMLYFQDGEGTEKEVAFVNTEYGEMVMYEASQAVVINTVDVYHGVYGYSTGLLNDFTFNAGRNVDANITSEADNGGILRIVTSAAHSLTTGDVVTLSNMNDAAHNLPTMVTVIDATTFDCDDVSYVAGAGTSAGVVDEPSYLKCGVASTHDYICSMSISGSSGGNSKQFKWEMWKNSTAIDNIVAERNHGVTDIGSMSCSGIIQNVALGDKIWLACENVTDTTNFSIEHSNINLHRL